MLVEYIERFIAKIITQASGCCINLFTLNVESITIVVSFYTSCIFSTSIRYAFPYSIFPFDIHVSLISTVINCMIRS